MIKDRDLQNDAAAEVRHDAHAPLHAAPRPHRHHRLGLDRVGRLERRLPGVLRPQVPSQVRNFRNEGSGLHFSHIAVAKYLRWLTSAKSENCIETDTKFKNTLEKYKEFSQGPFSDIDFCGKYATCFT